MQSGEQGYRSLVQRLSPSSGFTINPIPASSFLAGTASLSFNLSSLQAFRLRSIDASVLDISAAPAGKLVLWDFAVIITSPSSQLVANWPFQGTLGLPLSPTGLALHYESENLYFYNDFQEYGSLIGAITLSVIATANNTDAINAWDLGTEVEAIIEIYNLKPTGLAKVGYSGAETI